LSRRQEAAANKTTQVFAKEASHSIPRLPLITKPAERISVAEIVHNN
jgi:hypothetical protein